MSRETGLPNWLEGGSVSRAPAGRRAVVGILPGEGIGPEVVAASLRVLDALEAGAGPLLDRRTGGAIGLEADKGNNADNGAGSSDGRLTGEIAAFCKGIFDAGGAVLCGPGGGRFVYDLRRRFDLFCKLVPLKPSPSLRDVGRIKPEWLDGVDILVVRDNSGGVYQGHSVVRGDGAAGRVVEHRFDYSQAQVLRIVRVGARLAKARGGKMAVVVKDGGVPGISALWREAALDVSKESGVACSILNADYAAYWMIQNPRECDVLVTPNMVGDILADLGAVLLGSRGMSYSGNFGPDGRAVYQTSHGSAHDLAGTDRANPLAQILATAMMLRQSYGLAAEATRVEQAVEDVLAAGWCTEDLASPGRRVVGTRKMGELVAAAVTALARPQAAKREEPRMESSSEAGR